VKRERAIELVKWGHCYAKPRVKGAKEMTEAIAYVKAHPDTHKEISWTS
jgi:hypothetical protein